MFIARASSRWSSRVFAQSARATRSSRTWQPAQRRTYASEGGHSSQQSSMLGGDLPWALTSLAVTIPSVYYLMQPQIERYQHPERHGHGGHGGHKGHDEHDGHDEYDEHDEHDEYDEHGEDGESGEEGGSSEGESGDEKSEDPDEGGEEDKGEEKDTPNTSDDDGPENTAHQTESGEDVEGVQFKGATSGGTRDGEQGDTRKHIPDAKGFNKKRIESDYGKRQGEARKPEQDPRNEDLGAASKPPGSFAKMSGKQEGLSNTDTKHSTDIAGSPEKSTKGEGDPETAKVKGTVDPSRPQV